MAWACRTRLRVRVFTGNSWLVGRDPRGGVPGKLDCHLVHAEIVHVVGVGGRSHQLEPDDVATRTQETRRYGNADPLGRVVIRGDVPVEVVDLLAVDLHVRPELPLL